MTVKVWRLKPLLPKSVSRFYKLPPHFLEPPSQNWPGVASIDWQQNVFVDWPMDSSSNNLSTNPNVVVVRYGAENGWFHGQTLRSKFFLSIVAEERVQHQLDRVNKQPMSIHHPEQLVFNECEYISKYYWGKSEIFPASHIREGILSIHYI